MPTVYQQSVKRDETPGQRRLRNWAEKLLSAADFIHTRRFPRLFRDQWQTVGRLDPQNQTRNVGSRDPTAEQVGGNAQTLLTLKEVADYLRLTPAVLYTQRHRGHKPGALGIRVGRKILYRPSDINRYLDELLAENQVSLHR
jgi:hypothetical protein